MATRLKAREAVSLSICPESESRARLSVISPPKNSSSIIPPVMSNAIVRPIRSPGEWECAWLCP
ncbi:hypothetical protein D3C71_2227520 [compost metagenome]